MFCSPANAVSSGCWPILFKVLTLNVAIYIVLLHLSKFFLCLSSVADFLNTGGWTSNLNYFTGAKSDAVWTYGLSGSHGNLSMAVFYDRIQH